MVAGLSKADVSLMLNLKMKYDLWAGIEQNLRFIC